MVALCLFLVINLRSNILYEEMFMNSRYNVIMDNGVENALKMAYEKVGINGKPIVNKEVMSEYLLDEISIMFDGVKNFRDYYGEEIKVLIYTEEDGFYYYDIKNGWSEIIAFSDGENTEHSKKVFELLKYVEDNYKVTLTIPLNDGELFLNTVDDYSLIAVYRTYENAYCFSAAKIIESDD